MKQKRKQKRNVPGNIEFIISMIWETNASIFS